MSIKIGLLLDSITVPVWQWHIIQFIRSNPSFTLSVVVLNNAPTKSSASIVYRFFRKLDRQVFKSKHDCFGRVDVTDLLEGVNIINVKPHQTKHTDSLATDDIEKIKSSQPDVLIRFGFRILKGDILQSTQYGVWSLHHGDNAVNRGGPPAFWEVVNREAVTGVTLQKLSDDLDGGTVIDKAFIRTDGTSFNRNQVALYWAGVELLCNALAKLSTTPKLPSPQGEGQGVRGFYSHPLYKNPTNTQALFIFSAFWLRRIKESVVGVFKKPRWAVYYSVNKRGLPRPAFSVARNDINEGGLPRADATVSTRNDGVGIETSLFRYKKLTPPRGTDWADPFVVKHEEKYYLFFEELRPSDEGKAHISYLVFDEKGKQLTKEPTIALKEPHHLSYPFLITHEGDHYMIPEAASSNSVWLYKEEKFPAQWKRYREVLSNTTLYDPTLVFHEGLWYLFGTQKPFAGNSPDQYLFIYFTDDIVTGTWQAHSMNPQTRDVRCARPAGKIFKDNGKLIRPVQLGAPKYGYGISFFEITKLSPIEFEQHHIQNILPHWRKGLRATHTFNFEEGFSVVDAQG